VIALLDSAGIRRALVLSIAYTWGNPSRHVEDEYEKVKAEIIKRVTDISHFARTQGSMPRA